MTTCSEALPGNTLSWRLLPLGFVLRPGPKQPGDRVTVHPQVGAWE